MALHQDGYRLRNDDGSETTATWRAATNTAASLGVDTRRSPGDGRGCPAGRCGSRSTSPLL